MRPTLTNGGVALNRVGRLVCGGFAATLIAPWIGAVAANASTSIPVSGDPRATVGSLTNITQDGNGTAHTTGCALLGFPNDQSVGADEGNGLDSGGFVVTNDGKFIDLVSVPDGVSVDVFIVKGSDAYNVYPASVFTTLPVDDMHAPINASGGPAGVSHWFLCYGPADEQPPVVTPPSADATGDCDVANITLHAGTAQTDFLVTRLGDAGVPYTVGAGQDLTLSPIPVDASHSTVTVTALGMSPQTFTRNNAICDADNGGGGDNQGGGGDNQGGGGDNSGGGGDNQGGGGGDNQGGGGDQGGNGGNAGGGSTGATVTNPATSASDACKTGITVTLSNLGATVPVTFTLIGPDGSTSSATVGANQSTTRSFAVAEDATGTVTVSAPGLTTKTFSYHKNCVTVLGVKHVRRHHHRQKPQGDRTNVLGNGAQAAQLPFTGFNARSGLVEGGLTIALGLALCVAAARRPERPAPGRHRR